ncbi:MAG: TlpA disulfide reductase family protein [Candidatus Pedobacter colombiensis]|uniref:TlpA disulfide reductase family protein n=1 Tax=Candidatus Pedobacter colombiensis TaxID=3121371 RepID=A0AAJ5W5P3_9SPHI|nr:TlpA disulfide reductase family protein [Pedobacter sp.]WEK18474.1 MAG: TlpA disulfide reductase family protein [Pedobacter sp.]
MKRSAAFLAIILGSIFTTQAQFTEITGLSKKSKVSKVKLFKVEHGRVEEIAERIPGTSGSFNFKFQPVYKGYYLVGFGDANQGLQDKFKLYVKGNDKINLILTDSTYVLTGKNNKENQVLEQWYKFNYKLERKTVYFNRGRRGFTDFFPLLDQVTSKAQDWLIGKETGNANFDQLMKSTVNYDPAYYALTLLLVPTASKPSEEDYTNYVKNFDANQFLQNDELLKFPYGVNMLDNLVAFKNKGLGSDFDRNVMSIAGDKLKGEYALKYAGLAKSYIKYKDIVDKYGKYFISDDQKMRAEGIAKKMDVYKPGAKAIDFTYPDVSGKQVSLSDFKGKVVLVDVWATWCGPCVKEIPYLKALEKEFHGKDVVFMSVSVDEEKDKDKWKKYVAEEQLVGVQLMASGWSKIAKDYKINGIPRFMVFDKNGNIVDIDSARPSDPKLKALLNEYLNKAY